MILMKRMRACFMDFVLALWKVDYGTLSSLKASSKIMWIMAHHLHLESRLYAQMLVETQSSARTP